MWCVYMQIASKITNTKKQEETLKYRTSSALQHILWWNFSFVSCFSKFSSRCYMVVFYFREIWLGVWWFRHLVYRHRDQEMETWAQFYKNVLQYLIKECWSHSSSFFYPVSTLHISSLKVLLRKEDLFKWLKTYSVLLRLINTG